MNVEIHCHPTGDYAPGIDNLLALREGLGEGVLNVVRMIDPGDQDTTKLYMKQAEENPGTHAVISLTPYPHGMGSPRKTRKDLYLVTAYYDSQGYSLGAYSDALLQCKRTSSNLVFVRNRAPVLSRPVDESAYYVVAPEETYYHHTLFQDWAFKYLGKMVAARSQLHFTRSTVVPGELVPWNSPEIPDNFRRVVNWLIDCGVYRPVNGVTAGHFAVKLASDTFLTSVRKSNFNNLAENGLVKVRTEGEDKVIAYGAKPSVGGQSQRIVFAKNEKVGYDCIVHFHCPLKEGSRVPVASQWQFECGSHECGENTAKNMVTFSVTPVGQAPTVLSAVYLDNHGPNIVFNSKSASFEAIRDFIVHHFDITEKTGGPL